MEKTTRRKINFSKAFYLLRGTEVHDARELIKARCKWGSDGTFSMKMNGNRSMTDEEWLNVVDVLKGYGIDAEKQVLIESQAS